MMEHFLARFLENLQQFLIVASLTVVLSAALHILWTLFITWLEGHDKSEEE